MHSIQIKREKLQSAPGVTETSFVPAFLMTCGRKGAYLKPVTKMSIKQEDKGRESHPFFEFYQFRSHLRIWPSILTCLPLTPWCQRRKKEFANCPLPYSLPLIFCTKHDTNPCHKPLLPQFRLQNLIGLNVQSLVHAERPQELTRELPCEEGAKREGGKWTAIVFHGSKTIYPT